MGQTLIFLSGLLFNGHVRGEWRTNGYMVYQGMHRYCRYETSIHACQRQLFRSRSNGARAGARSCAQESPSTDLLLRPLLPVCELSPGISHIS